jgi:putative ABC transport system ATP-binding protein
MANTILKLEDLRKVYIMGDRKTAQKAQKEIIKLHKRYESAHEEGNDYKGLEKQLIKAQSLFADEKYAEAYEFMTGRKIKEGKNEKGVVVHALNGVDLEIKEGEMVAIMGPSGSGKSTLLNMLGLLDAPTTGKIYLRGQNVTSLKGKKLPEVRSKELGFVFQSFNLIPTLTALENVMLPLKYSRIPVSKRKQMAEDALNLVGLGERMQHSPNELSGGQRQRVAIARALVNNPSIILADEPTGNLDSQTGLEIMALFDRLHAQGNTIVLVTHEHDISEYAHRVIHIKDGQVYRDERGTKKRGIGFELK